MEQIALVLFVVVMFFGAVLVNELARRYRDRE